MSDDCDHCDKSQMRVKGSGKENKSGQHRLCGRYYTERGTGPTELNLKKETQ